MAVLVSAVPPLMLKTERNPSGRAVSVFDGIRAGVAGDRSQFYKELTLPIYRYNRPRAKIVKHSTLKVYSGFPHGMCITHADQVNADMLAYFQ
jgi:hypothetical protein